MKEETENAALGPFSVANDSCSSYCAFSNILWSVFEEVVISVDKDWSYYEVVRFHNHLAAWNYTGKVVWCFQMLKEEARGCSILSR